VNLTAAVAAPAIRAATAAITAAVASPNVPSEVGALVQIIGCGVVLITIGYIDYFDNYRYTKFSIQSSIFNPILSIGLE
jgi:hypothetical protein